MYNTDKAGLFMLALKPLDYFLQQPLGLTERHQCTPKWTGTNKMSLEKMSIFLVQRRTAE